MKNNLIKKVGLSFVMAATIICSSNIFAQDKVAKDENKITLYPVEPVALPWGTDGTAGEYAYYALFGYLPQTIKADDVEIDTNTLYVVNGWNSYKGSDGCYYVKSKARPWASFKSDKKFSNGTAIESGVSYYFKIEPVKWRVLDFDFQEGADLLLAEKVLVSSPYYADKEKQRLVGGKQTFQNNYEFSTIRAFLNGLNGTAYEVEDFTHKGFVDMVFVPAAREFIKTTLVDNGPSTTTDYKGNITKAGKFVSKNTEDKVFLLSEEEVTNNNYGFDDYKVEDPLSTRNRQVTDYAKAMGASAKADRNYANNGCWWLRTPSHSSEQNARCVLDVGNAFSTFYVNQSYGGVVPALTVNYELIY